MGKEGSYLMLGGSQVISRPRTRKIVGYAAAVALGCAVGYLSCLLWVKTRKPRDRRTLSALAHQGVTNEQRSAVEFLRDYVRECAIRKLRGKLTRLETATRCIHADVVIESASADELIFYGDLLERLTFTLGEKASVLPVLSINALLEANGRVPVRAFGIDLARQEDFLLNSPSVTYFRDPAARLHRATEGSNERGELPYMIVGEGVVGHPPTKGLGLTVTLRRPQPTRDSVLLRHKQFRIAGIFSGKVRADRDTVFVSLEDLRQVLCTEERTLDEWRGHCTEIWVKREWTNVPPGVESIAEEVRDVCRTFTKDGRAKPLVVKSWEERYGTDLRSLRHELTRVEEAHRASAMD